MISWLRGHKSTAASRWVRRRSFDSQLVAKVTRRRHLLCVGDSHVQVFMHIAKNRLLPATRIEMFRMNGATALGAANPNAPTDAMPVFRQRLASAKPFQTIAFQLGEVDCGFVIWYRAKHDDLGVEEQLVESITAYMRFLDDVRSMGLTKLVVVSVPLPVIDDDHYSDAFPNARREVDASQRARTELTLRYNDLLRAACESGGYAFLDVSSSQLDRETHVIRADLVGNPGDHHLDKARYAAVIVPGLGHLLTALEVP